MTDSPARTQLKRAHKLAAAVAGTISIALERGKLNRRAMADSASNLDEASAILKGIGA